jgi:maleylacetoacetate isomerase
MTIRLYDYWRSSAAYRVRIALNLKGLVYESINVDLLHGGQRDAAYMGKNPQGLVPLLEMGETRISQSLAIIDWLDSYHPEPRLVPVEPDARATALAMAYTVAMDIHPVNNARILAALRQDFGADEAQVTTWIGRWISDGFAALEAQADPSLPYLGGEAPGIADLCLIPQIYNARRFSVSLDGFPKLIAVDAACAGLEAFQRAHPDAVKPA